MLQYELIEISRIVFAVITLFSFLCSLLYYRRIHHGKSISDFFINFLNYYGPMSLKNTAEENRKKFKKVNNSCMVFLWLSLIGQFVLFVTR